jgi:histidine triad (HIT) family protein
VTAGSVEKPGRTNYSLAREVRSVGETTIFDKILAKQAPADVVHEDDDVLAFRDVNPQAPVHVLVIPKRKVRSFAELAGADPAATGAFFSAVARVASALGLDGDGYRVVFNCGRHGQQTVGYLHAHVLGGRQLKWPPG